MGTDDAGRAEVPGVRRRVARDRDAARNAIISVGGPDAVTLREVVDAYAAALGRPISVRSVAPGEPLPGLPPLVSQLASALESFDSPMPMEETARTFGVALTDSHAFARARAAAIPR